MTTPRTHTQAASASSGLDALIQQAQASQRTGPSGDGAAFQRWMQQYRQPQGAEAAPQAPPGAPVAATRAQVARDGRARDADLQSNAQVQDDAESTPTTHAPSNTQPGRTAGKDVRKPVAARPQEQARTTRSEGQAQATADAPAEGGEEAGDAGDAVRFQTAQGEATAWVKELPVPDDVAASDPAAMLAWLSSLHSPVQQGVVTQGDEQALGEGRGQTPLPTDPVGRPLARHGSADALTLQALQRGPSDSGMSQGRDDGASSEAGQGALSLRALGLSETSTAGSDVTAASFASALQREMQPANGARAESAARHYTGNLHTPMDSPAFTQALTDRVAFWVNGPAAEGPMTAELRLNPAEMGPVHIRIELDGQNAQIDFAAAAAETRQAIEASLGQLSAALEESGLKLAGGGVSDQTPQQQAWAQASGQPGDGQGGSARQGRNPEGRWASAGVPDPVAESLGARPARPGRAGGLDLYA